MCWRQVSKLQKTAVVATLTLLYFILSFAMTPAPRYTFVPEDLRIGDKYVLIFLVSKTPVFSDAEGANVFESRQCGGCFITNNVGFLPQREYDAVLVHGDRSYLRDTPAFSDPENKYLLEASIKCLGKKLVGCGREPRSTAFYSRAAYGLCELCQHLRRQRQRRGPAKR